MRFAFIVLILMLPALASASSAKQASLKELVDLSTDIVVGQVETRQSFWEKQRIYTKHLVTVQDTWLGAQSEKTIQVLTLGGVVGEFGQNVDGSPKLQPGQQVLLFMVRDARAGLHPIGLSQGVFYLGQQTPKGQRVSRDLRAFGFINDASASFPNTLEELRVRVKEILR